MILTPADVMAQERARWDRELLDNPAMTAKDISDVVGCGRRGAGYIMRAVKHVELGEAVSNHRTHKLDLEEWLLNAAAARPISLAVEAGVYFMGCGDAVKIGVTNNHWQRLDSIQACNPNPVRTLLLFDGDAALEAYFHGRFREHLIHSEWFRREGSLDEFLEHYDQ